MKKQNIVNSIIAVGFLWILYQLWLPTLSLAYLDGAAFFGICIVTFAVVIGISKLEYDVQTAVKIPIRTLIIVVIVLLIGSLIGSPAISNSVAYSQIGDILEKSFIKDVVEIDNSQIPTVDTELATKLADRKSVV